MVGKLSPQGNEGTLMGIWQLVIGVSAIVGSQIATHARVEFSNIVTQQHSYVNLFNRLGLTMMIAGAAVLLISRHVKALLDEAKDEHTHANEPANQNA